MNQVADLASSAVPAEEVAHRVAEYKRLGFANRAKPHVVYHGPWVLCPWPSCGYPLAGIDFQLETGDAAAYQAYLAAWWQGSGLVGKCPACQQYVLFSATDKKCVTDTHAAGLALLPEDWIQRAYVL